MADLLAAGRLKFQIASESILPSRTRNMTSQFPRYRSLKCPKMRTDPLAVSIIIFAYSCQSLQHEFYRSRLQGRFHGPGIFPGLWLFDGLDGYQTDKAKSEPTTKFVHLHDLGRDLGEPWNWNTWVSVPQRCNKTRVCIAFYTCDLGPD